MNILTLALIGLVVLLGKLPLNGLLLELLRNRTG